MLECSRSSFLLGATAALAGGGCISPGKVLSAYDNLAVGLRIGAIASPCIDGPASRLPLVAALKYLRELGVDAIAVAGDLTENGYLAQLKLFADAWNEVFRGAFPLREGRPGSGPVPILAAGERDLAGWRRTEGETPPESAIAADPARAWREILGLEWSPSFTTQVRGYRFIGIHHLDERGPDRAALEKELAALSGEERAGRRPFFIVQHPVPYGTCCRNAGGWNFCDRGQEFRLLRELPSAVVISGRSRTPLTDDSAIWRDEFFSVNASALATLFTAPGRENGFSPADPPPGGEPLSAAETAAARHILAINVYASSIRFERLDPERRERVAEDLSFPIKPRAAKPPEPKAPRFWDDTIIAAIRGNLRARGARIGEAVYTVAFPAVLARHTGMRAYDYEVKAIPLSPSANSGGASPCVAREIVKLVYSPAHLLAERHEKEPVRCIFTERELAGAAKWKFAVTPRNAFGKAGDARFSPVISISAR